MFRLAPGCCLGFFLLAGLPARAMAEDITSEPQAVSELKNPYTTPEDARRGHMLVRAFCSVCHGRDGKGGRGPDLTGNLRRGNSDEAILNNIKNGIPGTDMIGFPVEDQFAWLVISYIRSERAKGNQVPVKGDAARGEQLFVEHKCIVCHWHGTDGGRRGPDLSALAAPIDYVRTSIIDPDANFRDAPAYQHDPYQMVSIITRRGRVLEGRWLNENAYFLLFMDAQDQPRRIAHSDIDQLYKPRRSLMPKGFGRLLTAKELDDLIAYLFSLRPKIAQE